MKRGKNTRTRATAEASAKLEAVAKVAYTRKKIITEVIPSDATRAKSSSWLSLISPLTEWAASYLGEGSGRTDLEGLP